MNTYLDLNSLGIERFVLHRIKAFCPETGALLKLHERCAATEELHPDGNLWTHKLHERPAFQDNTWKLSPGFTPTFTVGKSAASALLPANGHHWIARLLRQGIGILTQAEETQDENKLVESNPTKTDNKTNETNETNETNVLTQLAVGIKSSFDELVMKSQGADKKPWLEDTSYEVVEIVFRNSAALANLTADENTDEAVKKLREAVAYFLLRSYDMTPEDRSKPALERVTYEVNLMALEGLAKTVDGGVKLKNLSQSTRGFVTLGPRGAVIAFAEDSPHPNLRVAALNMIEILRGRHFNLIIARTFADDTIRKLSTLAHLAQNGDSTNNLDYESEIPQLLKKIMVANYLYGLVVSDPGIYLLDGSTLSRLADVADTWLNLRSLREDTERKMAALYRLWQSFQDSQRIQIIGALSRSSKKS